MDFLQPIKNKVFIFKGWVDLILKQEQQYKYFVDRIELKSLKNETFSLIHYRLIGCRKRLSERASELNSSTLFALFRPDHAQMIVSIATAEALIGKTTEEIHNKFEKYVSYCNLKLERLS